MHRLWVCIDKRFQLATVQCTLHRAFGRQDCVLAFCKHILSFCGCGAAGLFHTMLCCHYTDSHSARLSCFHSRQSEKPFCMYLARCRAAWVPGCCCDMQCAQPLLWSHPETLWLRGRTACRTSWAPPCRTSPPSWTAASAGGTTTGSRCSRRLCAPQPQTLGLQALQRNPRQPAARAARSRPHPPRQRRKLARERAGWQGLSRVLRLAACSGKGRAGPQARGCGGKGIHPIAQQG